MTAIQLLDDLHKSDKLELLVQSGLISVNVIVWHKIYNAYQYQIANGSNKLNAVDEVSDVFGTSRSTIYRILKNLNTTIKIKNNGNKKNLH